MDGLRAFLESLRSTVTTCDVAVAGGGEAGRIGFTPHHREESSGLTRSNKPSSCHHVRVGLLSKPVGIRSWALPPILSRSDWKPQDHREQWHAIVGQAPSPRRKGPPQHSLPRLPGPHGTGGVWRAASRCRTGSSITSRPFAPSSTHPATMTPGSCPAPATRRARSRSTRGSGSATRSGSSPPGSLASASTTGPPASSRAGGRRWSWCWSSRTAATSTVWGWPRERPRYVTALGDTDAPDG
jgi:hypothetical protein